jgi:hypothetical protein
MGIIEKQRSGKKNLASSPSVSFAKGGKRIVLRFLECVSIKQKEILVFTVGSLCVTGKCMGLVTLWMYR